MFDLRNPWVLFMWSNFLAAIAVFITGVCYNNFPLMVTPLVVTVISLLAGYPEWLGKRQIDWEFKQLDKKLSQPPKPAESEKNRW